MTELAALNVKITGDAGDLRAALQSAEDGLENVANQAKATQAEVGRASGRFTGLGDVLGKNAFAINNAANQFSDLAVQIGAGVPASRALSQQLPQITAFMGPLANIIGVTAGVLIGMGGAFLTARDGASEFEKQLAEVGETIDELTLKMRTLTLGVSTEELTLLDAIAQKSAEIGEIQAEMERLSGRNLRAAEQRLVAAQNELAQYRAQLAELRNLQAEKAQLEQTIQETTDAERLLGEQIQEAARQAAVLAYELQKSRDAAMEAAREFIALQDIRSRFAGEEMVMGQDVLQVGRGQPAPEVPDAATGGAATVDPFEAELAALQESLMTQEELQLASYQRQQETLEQALAQKLITQQEYNALMQDAQAQHQDAMAAIDAYRYGTGLDKTQAFLGDMASALASGNDEMLRVSKAFAAAEALINAWRAYSQTIADPTLPFVAKLAAGASVLAAGMSAVNAINGASTSGGAASAATSTAATAAPTTAAPTTSSQVAIQLTGGDMYSRDQIVDLINAINEAQEDGAVVRLV